jgi:hypothetical protein
MMLPDREPTAPGEKLNVVEHVAFAAIAPVQVLVITLKSLEFVPPGVSVPKFAVEVPLVIVIVAEGEAEPTV